ARDHRREPALAARSRDRGRGDDRAFGRALHGLVAHARRAQPGGRTAPRRRGRTRRGAAQGTGHARARKVARGGARLPRQHADQQASACPEREPALGRAARRRRPAARRGEAVRWSREQGIGNGESLETPQALRRPALTIPDSPFPIPGPMQPTIRRKLEQLAERHEELEHLLASAEVLSDSKRLREVSREHAQLAPLAATLREWEAHGKALDAALAMQNDPELRELAREEATALEGERARLEHELNLLLVPKDPRDEGNLFLEIRAG